ncbi:hypothetical protein [Desulfoferrobacter suflitae]|uniref:hypothetical protein n=1 Tax=Desulfoferrobacter suflitae TaxID=2865782 RepID=UPI0021645ACE|nr:hypothetical protein [Desulfoferrobacter suflitae]MCK8602292.1 hypothetical protein [Desulfoferrobacter suflitae]
MVPGASHLFRAAHLTRSTANDLRSFAFDPFPRMIARPQGMVAALLRGPHGISPAGETHTVAAIHSRRTS